MQSSIFCNAVSCFLLLCFCFFPFNHSYSQEPASKVSFGLKGGFGLANISGSFTDENGATFSYSSKSSVFGGLRLFVPAGKNGLFIPEMVVMLKGAREKRSESANPPSGYYYDYNIPLSMFYVELPLNITYRKATKARRFFAGGGPSPAINIIEEYLGHTPTKSFDLGINFLAGYQFPIGFSLELNYTHGLMNISSHRNANLKSSNLGFSLAYAF